MPEAEVLDDELVGWIKEVTNGTSVKAERRSAGASRAGYAVDVSHDDGSVDELWLRLETGGGPQADTVYTVQREGAVYRALQATAVLPPPLVAIHPDRELFLTRRLDGRNWFSELTDEDERVSLATALISQIAELHRLVVRDLDLPELGPVKTVREHLADELEIWEEQYRRHPHDQPIIELALAWLRTEMPGEPAEPPVLVQGDTGPGNFMFRAGQLVAVTDWEMAHYGDPHEDLGWLYVRDLQERFTHLPDRLRDYERFSGREVDLDRLKYSIVLAQTKCAIGTLNGLHLGDARAELANHLIYSVLHVRMLGEALATATSAAHEPTDAPDALSGGLGWLFDVALHDLADVVLPAIEDGFAIRRAKGIARLVKFLQDSARYGEAAEAAELEDLKTILSWTPPDVEVARAQLCQAIREGAVETPAVLEYCLRKADRETFIARRAMGSLADRTYSPVGVSS